MFELNALLWPGVFCILGCCRDKRSDKRSQVIQNAEARVLKGTRKRKHISPNLASPQWLAFKSGIKFLPVKKQLFLPTFTRYLLTGGSDCWGFHKFKFRITWKTQTGTASKLPRKVPSQLGLQ